MEPIKMWPDTDVDHVHLWHAAAVLQLRININHKHTLLFGVDISTGAGFRSQSGKLNKYLLLCIDCGNKGNWREASAQQNTLYSVLYPSNSNKFTI